MFKHILLLQKMKFMLLKLEMEFIKTGLQFQLFLSFSFNQIINRKCNDFKVVQLLKRILRKKTSLLTKMCREYNLHEFPLIFKKLLEVLLFFLKQLFIEKNEEKHGKL